MSSSPSTTADRIAAFSGVFAVSVFCVSMVAFSILNSNFDPIHDFISFLGSKGQPFATWWNLFAFGIVGISLALFGWMYGCAIQDRLVGTLLALFGIGFAAAAIPIDFQNGSTGVSKAHILAVCLGVAAWMFGLARFASSASPDRFSKTLANGASTLLVLSAIGHVLGFWTMPILHRLVLGIVFSWVVVTSLRLWLHHRSVASGSRRFRSPS